MILDLAILTFGSIGFLCGVSGMLLSKETARHTRDMALRLLELELEHRRANTDERRFHTNGRRHEQN